MACLPLVRTIIDCLYNITFILLDPSVNGLAFRKSGFKKELHALLEDEKRYGGKKDWEEYIKEKRGHIDLAMRECGIDLAAVQAQGKWKTLGAYVGDKGPNGTLTKHQIFLKTFTHGPWTEYSGIAHGGFEGLRATGPFFTLDAQSYEFRPKMEEEFTRVMSLHLLRASTVAASTVVNVFLDDFQPFSFCVLSEQPKLVINVLPSIFERHPCVNRRFDSHTYRIRRR